MTSLQLLLLICAPHLATVVGLAVNIEDCEILDLSRAFDSDTIYWPGQPTFKFKPVYKGNKTQLDGSTFYYEAYKFRTAEHGGTHLDSPSHFYEKGLHTDQIPLKSLIGEACVVNVSQKADVNHDYELTQADVEDWEAKNGRTVDNCILLVDFGWEKYWLDRIQYIGLMHFPGIQPQAARWLTTMRQIKAVGVNVASLDHGQSQNFETHQVLGANSIPGFENLVNLPLLPPQGATIVALPMKIRNGSGGPLRAIAIGWNGSRDPCRRPINAQRRHHNI